MRHYILFFLLLISTLQLYSQLKWHNVDSLYQPLPKSVHVYFTDDKIEDTAVFRAYYLIADIKDKHLNFTTDTTYNRRLTPTQFYQKDEKPLVVVNGTFFSFDTNKSLNIVIKDGEAVSFNAPVKGKGKDSVNFYPSYKSAIGINKRRKADVAWIYTDTTMNKSMASQYPIKTREPIVVCCELPESRLKDIDQTEKKWYKKTFTKWRMQTAIGGGPVLLQNGEIKITNEEEQRFAGKAINDKHPRTAMGYTKDNKLIILVVEGRNNVAHGATLPQEAHIFKDLGCVEALNLDGGGSSCLLINGKETIKVSDKVQRAVPAVFIINLK